jgi:hypothetical protein
MNIFVNYNKNLTNADLSGGGFNILGPYSANLLAASSLVKPIDLSGLS